MTDILDIQLEALKGRMRLSKLIQSLVEDERWQALVGETKKSLRNAFSALLNNRLPLEEIRWWQGYYMALTIISQNKVANQVDQVSLEKQIKDMEQSGEMRQMLDAGNLPDEITKELLEASGL